MSGATGKAFIKLEVTLYLTEEEVRYLYAVAQYDHNIVKQALDNVTGHAAISKHASGFFTFMKTCKNDLGSVLHRLGAANDAFKDKDAK